jgi:hypothetical protein
MQTIIAFPENKEHLSALKAFLKALKIKFEDKEINYSPEFMAKIERGEEDIKNGNTKK